MGKSSEKKVAPTKDVHKIFLQAIKGQSYENQYRFILQTGLRIGEMTGLKWKDVNFETRIIQICRSMKYYYSTEEWRIGEPKMGYRTVPLTEEAITILKNQREKNKRISDIPEEWQEFVFLCRNGTPVKDSEYNALLFKICDKAQISRFSMHILRDTFVTRCTEAGMKPKILQILLGYNLHAHCTEEEKREEINRVEKALMLI